MGGSAKPRRPRAAPAALQVRGAGKKKEKKSRDGLFGCLVFLLIVGAIVLLATIDALWGDGTWRWAARNWPGGAYAFAVCLGAAAPLLFALFLRAMGGADRKSWKAHPARALGSTMLAVLAAAALVPFLSLAFNAVDSGKSKHRSGPPSWVFGNYPWLWAVGIFSTLATVVVLVWLTVLLTRRSDAART